MKVYTIGVYGFSEEAFFAKLWEAKVDTFCDVRWRRGVRGSEYVFANSNRLQKRLTELGIRYLHFRGLAPSPELRKRQHAADKEAGIARRKRCGLSEDFVEGYKAALEGFNARKFVEGLGPEARVIALFCVERQPAACHRSILAERLTQDLGTEIEVAHLTPDS